MPSVLQESSTITQIAEHSVIQLAQQFGTPLFVYDAATIAERIAELSQFDVVRYAQKACSNLAIVDLVRRNGALVDAVSAWEIRRAIAAGYVPGGEPPRIAYTADIFDTEALELIAEHSIAVNCGSPDMIDQYGELQRGTLQRPGKENAPGKQHEITLRINPGFGHGHSQKTNTGGEQSKHGIWHEQIAECVQRANRHQLTIAGLHMHIGSGTDMEHLSQVCGAMARAASVVGASIQSISAGGGLPTPYRAGDQRPDIGAYFKLWDETRNKLAEKFGHPISLEIEPGRYLVAESGSLIAEIRAVKQMGDNLFYLVDAGFNNLARPILYGAYHPMAISPATPEAGRGTRQRAGDKLHCPGQSEHKEVIVGGPLCESGDIFTQDEGGFVASRLLPEAHVGDYLVIGCTGAYAAVMGSNYNSKPMAPEVLLENGEVYEIRRRQTFEEMICGESIPEH